MITPFFGDIRSKIVDRLELAQQSIRIAMAWFTNGVLFQVLLTKAAGGVKIELILSDSESNFRQGSSLDFEALQRKGSSISVVNSGADNHFMHHKFAVIDGKEVITGSYNWSNNAHTNFENAILIEDESIARKYTVQFEYLLKKEVVQSLNNFKQTRKGSSLEISLETDLNLFRLSQEFNNSIDMAMKEAESLHVGLRMNIIADLIKRYTAVGAAKKLSNDDEQSGFIKLVSEKRWDLTFEYHTAQSRFAPLFDANTIRHAKDKLRKYIGSSADSL